MVAPGGCAVMLAFVDAATARRSGAGDPRLALGLAASLLLAGVACRELLRFAPKTHLVVSLTGGVEEFFFEPSDSSPIVVIALCGWLLWRRRGRLARLWGRRGSPLLTAALWSVATAGFAWSVRTGAPDLQALALVPALLGAANLLGGPGALRVVLLPAAVLVFAVPVPPPLLNHIVWPLQIWTADFTGLLLHLVGASALVSGDRIIMSDGLFAIIETCSGLRSIETLGMLSILMLDLFDRRGLHAVLLIVAAPPIAFLINGLRCLGLIYNPHAEIASIHSMQGIVMLLGGVLLLYAFDGLLEKFLRPAPPISPLEARERRRPEPRAPLAPRVMLVTAFAAVWVGVSWLPRFPVDPFDAVHPNELLADEMGGWTRVTHLETDWLFLGKAEYGPTLNRHYVRGNEAVELFVGQAKPRGRLRSYLSPKAGFPGSGWILESEAPGELAGRPVTFRELRKGTQRRLVASWYERSPGLWRESLIALFALDSGPSPRPHMPAALRLTTRLAGGPRGSDQARERLAGFAATLEPALNQMGAPRG